MSNRSYSLNEISETASKVAGVMPTASIRFCEEICTGLARSSFMLLQMAGETTQALQHPWPQPFRRIPELANPRKIQNHANVKPKRCDLQNNPLKPNQKHEKPKTARMLQNQKHTSKNHQKPQKTRLRNPPPTSTAPKTPNAARCLCDSAYLARKQARGCRLGTLPRSVNGTEVERRWNGEPGRLEEPKVTFWSEKAMKKRSSALASFSLFRFFFALCYGVLGFGSVFRSPASAFVE